MQSLGRRNTGALPAVAARFVGRLAVVAIGLALWWYMAQPSRVSPLVLPPPGKVLRELPSLLASSSFLSGLRITVTEVGLAFAFSTVVGLAIGVGIGSSRHWSEVVKPLLVWGQTVPIILLYPVCLMLFGVGSMSKVVFAGVYGAFPVALSSMTGFSSCPESLRVMARAFGASRAKILFKVEFGTAWPMLVSGLRLAAALNMIGVLAGQMLGATGGLGYNIVSAEGSFLTDQVYGYIIAVVILVFVFNGMITLAERLLVGRDQIRRLLARSKRSKGRGARGSTVGLAGAGSTVGELRRSLQRPIQQ